MAGLQSYYNSIYLVIKEKIKPLKKKRRNYILENKVYLTIIYIEM